MKAVTVLLPAAVILFAILLLLECIRLRRDDEELDLRESLAAGTRDGRIRRADLCLLGIMMAVYAAVAFYDLGNTQAVQSFCDFADRGRFATVEFSEPTELTRIQWYAGYGPGKYYISISDDGENWTDSIVLDQGVNSVFKWNDAEMPEGGIRTKFLRLVADGKVEMGELALYGADGKLIPVSALSYTPGAHQLFDEQALVAERTYRNSTYFDEIYHARTAYENIHDIYPYEITHPPLGKIIISLGIRLFGMTPFGWRFMGTLFGVISKG
jgi:dolichyl-phosphate-mannose-protein mannosyltransferase